MFLPGGKQTSKLEDKFSDESLVGTSEGVVRARTIRRLPPAQRGDKDLLLAKRGVLWKPVPGVEDDSVPAVVNISARAVVPLTSLPPPAEPRTPVQSDHAECTSGETRSWGSMASRKVVQAAARRSTT